MNINISFLPKNYLSETPVKLNLGAGKQKLPGFLSVDILPGCDLSMDLENEIWPWADNSVDEIVAEHFVEHIQSLRYFLNNCHRVMKTGGKLRIVTPSPMSEFYWQDPTHVRGYTPNTFMLYCTGEPGTEHAGIIPWFRADVWQNEQMINGVRALIVVAILTK